MDQELNLWKIATIVSCFLALQGCLTDDKTAASANSPGATLAAGSGSVTDPLIKSDPLFSEKRGGIPGPGGNGKGPGWKDATTTTTTNNPPTISGTPATSVVQDNAYEFIPSANDIDGDVLTFNITYQPGWSRFDTATGALTGTPGAGDVGTYGSIVIGVSDGQATAQLPAFSISVEANDTTTTTTTNNPPTISGTPATSVVQDNAYEFIPSANDIDGDVLTFNITNQPVWSAFDTTTGALTGTPGAGDVGTYSNIVIGVSDGQATAQLPAFSIGVEAIASGSTTLSWVAPTENIDGSTLTNLAGYRIYWGPQSNDYTNSVAIMNPGVTTYVVENLGSGTYHFAATALNDSGAESAFSNDVQQTIP